MFEFIKNILVDMILFSGFDSIVVLSFFLIDRNINFNIKQFILLVVGLSFINSLFSDIIPPIVFQIIFIMYTGLLLAYLYKFELKKSMFSILKITVIMLVIEIGISFIMAVILKIDIVNSELTLNKFLLCIPFRIVEFGFIYYLYKRRK